MKVIIAINAGSSSLKISAYSAESRNDTSPKEIASAQISGLSAPPRELTYSRLGQPVHKDKEMDGGSASLGDAFNLLIETLITDEELREISSKEDIAMACHRVVHGGDYETAQLITKDTYHHIEKLSDLAPLHNSAALGIINSCVKELRTAVNIACFDTQFHTSIPSHISTYPIDQDIAQNNRLRKYGFHGISYAFIARSVAQFLDKPQEKLNIIALHLGSGASACAIKDGKSWDTSMGLTPLAGLPGATRSGSVDPSLVFHYASDAGKLSPASTARLHISKAEEILNKHCGWSAITGHHSFAKIAASQEPQCILAFQLLVDRIAGFIGSYYVSLQGQVDALVFAGGIGENSASLRAAVSERVSCLGFAIDEAANEKFSKDPGAKVVTNITDANKPSSILVCRTNEQFEMARTCTSRQELWSDHGT